MTFFLAFHKTFRNDGEENHNIEFWLCQSEKEEINTLRAKIKGLDQTTEEIKQQIHTLKVQKAAFNSQLCQISCEKSICYDRLLIIDPVTQCEKKREEKRIYNSRVKHA